VIDGLIKGTPLRQLAKISACSLATLSKYRDKVVIPTLSGQLHAKVNKPVNAVVNTPERGEQPLQPVVLPATNLRLSGEQALAERIASTSPVRERLAKLEGRTERIMDRVEAGDDLSIMPGLLNQAHKNVELLAKVTGEIQDGRGPAAQVAIQIVYPHTEHSAAVEAPGITIGVKGS
jgi:hypothetical protein